MDLKDYREKIDEIDENLVYLFAQRMTLSSQIAAYKKEHDLPIYFPEREQQILEKISKMARPDLEIYTRELFSFIFELSRNYQSKFNCQNSSPENDTEVV